MQGFDSSSPAIDAAVCNTFSRVRRGHSSVHDTGHGTGVGTEQAKLQASKSRSSPPSFRIARPSAQGDAVEIYWALPEGARIPSLSSIVDRRHGGAAESIDQAIKQSIIGLFSSVGKAPAQ